MSHTKEWEALNRIWKTLTKEQRAGLYSDFELVHAAIQRSSAKIDEEISENNAQLSELQKQEAVKIETAKQTNDISDVLVLRKSGDYFEVRGRSAHVLHQISGLKMSKQGKENRSWFKKEKLDHYVSAIEKYSISYIIREPNNLIIKRKDFGNNRFREFLEPRMLSKTERISVGDRVAIINLETKEKEEYFVSGSYLKYEVTGEKNRFGNRVIKKTWYSDADINEGTINIDSPLIQALKGVKIGEEFQVRVGEWTTRYKLLNIEKA